MNFLLRLLPVLVWLALALALSLPLLALGVRWQWWGYQLALPLLAGVALTAALVLALAGVGLLLANRRGLSRSRNRAILVILLLAVPLGVVFNYGLKAGQAPVIYDISTDWDNPPALGARPAGANEPQTPGQVAAAQAQHYPGVRSLRLPLAPEQALVRARQGAEQLGWKVQTLDSERGQLQATARTFWFGFTDDVTVRVRPDPEDADSARLDVRSTSRVGKSDLGKNAERILKFLAAMEAS